MYSARRDARTGSDRRGRAGSALALDVVSRGDAVAQNPLTLTDTNPLKH